MHRYKETLAKYVFLFLAPFQYGLLPIVIIIIMVILKCYFSREHIARSLKKRCEHRNRKTNRLKALCVMQNNILNKQTMCQQTKTKHENKGHIQKMHYAKNQR